MAGIDTSRSTARLDALQASASLTKEAVFPAALAAGRGLWAAAKGIGGAIRGSRAVSAAVNGSKAVARGVRPVWQAVDDIAFKPYMRQMEELGGNVLLHGANAVSKIGGKLGRGAAADAIANRMISLSPNANTWTGIGLSTAGGLGVSSLFGSSGVDQAASLDKAAGVNHTHTVSLNGNGGQHMSVRDMQKRAGLMAFIARHPYISTFGSGTVAGTAGYGVGKIRGYNSGFEAGKDDLKKKLHDLLVTSRMSGKNTKAAADRSSARLAVLQKSAGIKDVLIGTTDGSFTNAGIIPKLLANEDLRRSLVGAAAAGTTAALVSERKNKLRNGLLSALAGGLGTYGLSATGALDNRLSPYPEINRSGKKLLRRLDAGYRTRSMLGKLSPVERMLEDASHKTHRLSVSV